MAAHVFWAVFCSNWQPSQISLTAENNGAAIPPPIFFLFKTYEFLSPKIVHCANIPTLETSSKKIGGGENKTNTTFLADFSLQNCFRKHGC